MFILILEENEHAVLMLIRDEMSRRRDTWNVDSLLISIVWDAARMVGTAMSLLHVAESF